jgi:predicted DNA-binding helix-hairpin-helix protein
LLRVPGLGVRNVDRILRLRRQRSLRLSDLRSLRVPLRRAQPFLITADCVRAAAKHLDSAALDRLVRPKSVQLDLFDTALSARSGEL